MSSAVTFAGMLSVYLTVDDVTCVPSIRGGVALTFVTASDAKRAPSVPDPGRTSGPAAITHEYEAVGCAPRESHVQSTDVPVPAPAPTVFPCASFTVTVH